MNAIDIKLQEIKREKRVGLMTHVVIGYPSLQKTISLITTMEKAGSDFIELQIPFSDPLADGPTIMKACEKALEKGVRVRDAFVVAQSVRKTVSIPLLFMAYYNTIFKYGAERFCKDAQKAGISGLIVPDMPLEEEKSEHFTKYCNTYGLYNIRVISPASTQQRLLKNAKSAHGFVYCTARQGITGAKEKLDPLVISYLTNVKKYIKIPLAVGFGISKKEQVQAVSRYAEIVVVGSALINIINSSKEIEKDVDHFIRLLKMI